MERCRFWVITFQYWKSKQMAQKTNTAHVIQIFQKSSEGWNMPWFSTKMDCLVCKTISTPQFQCICMRHDTPKNKTIGDGGTFYGLSHVHGQFDPTCQCHCFRSLVESLIQRIRGPFEFTCIEKPWPAQISQDTHTSALSQRTSHRTSETQKVFVMNPKRSGRKRNSKQTTHTCSERLRRAEFARKN